LLPEAAVLEWELHHRRWQGRPERLFRRIRRLILFNVGTVESVLEQAPSDVVNTVRWLLTEGWETKRVVPRHGMVHSVLELAAPNAEALILSGRGVWSLDLRQPGQEWIHFDLIYVFLTADETIWDGSKSCSHRESPGVSSFEVSWHSYLPAALDWLTSSAEVSAQVADARRRRDEIRWPRSEQR